MFTKEEFRKWIIGLIVETIITVVFIIILGNYSSKLNNVYLHGQSMTLVNAFKIIGDPDYMRYFVWSIIFIILLIGIGFFAFRHGLEIDGEATNYKLLLVLGYPIVNLILLITLLIVFYSPIFLAAIIGLIVVGVVLLAVNSEQ